jgi:regulator of replication initiation timing
MMKSKTLASAVACALTLSVSGIATADPLDNLHKEEKKIHQASVKSQQKIDRLYEQSLDLLTEYRNTVDETDNLRLYNDHVAKLVAGQEEVVTSLQKQINSIEDTKKGVVPLMYKMLDSLEKFIEADIPLKLETRKERVARIRDLMSNPNITTSERFRQVLEAYEIENDYGNLIAAYQGEVEGKVVDIVHVGRIALVAQSLDLKHAWVWDNSARKWTELPEEYNKQVNYTIRMARKQVSNDLVKLPIFAAESAN